MTIIFVNFFVFIMIALFNGKIFLNVLSQSPEIAPEVFAKVLESLRGDEFAQFMNGHCPISIKAKIINALPKTKFLKASIRSIFE